MDKIHLLEEYGISTILRVNIDQDNIESIPMLMSSLEKENFHEVNLSFKPIHELTSKECKICGYTDKEFAKFAPAIWEQGLKRGFRVLNIDIHESLVYCGNQMTNNLAIDPFGDLYTCLNHIGDHKHKFGTVENGANDPIFTHVYYNWMSRNPLNLEDCNNCKLLPVCSGGCAGQAHYKKGGYHFGHCITEKWLIKELVTLNHRYKKQEET